jgi:hypothetical protein
MKEKVHTALAKLVGKYGSISMDPRNLEILINSALEPDQINKRLIAENILNTLTVPVEWLINHTIRAKELAIRCLYEAFENRYKGDDSHLKYLGWAFHFIADWGTPPHSPTAKSNPVPALIGIGALIGGILGGISASQNDLGEVLKGIAIGAVAGAGISAIPGLIGLAIIHNDFEILCERRWERLESNIINCFKKRKNDQFPFEKFENAIDRFEEMMDKLRQKANNLSANWIATCKESEFVDYIIQIAIIMDFTCQMILR